MIRLKKVVALFLGVALVVSMAACGNTKSGTSEATTTEESTAKSTTTGPAQKVTITFVNPGNAMFDGDTDNQLIADEIKKKFLADTNIELELKGTELSWTGYADKINLMLSSKETLDVFPIWSSEARKYIQNGFIQPLDDQLKNNGENVKKLVPADAWRFTTLNDKIYGYPRLIYTKDVGTFIRTDWLEKAGVEMPTNADELYTVLKAFKEKDVAGNGKTIPAAVLLFNELGSNTSYGNNLPMMLFGISNQAESGLFKDTDGTYKPTILHPKFKDAMEYAKKLYSEGLVSKDHFNYKNNSDLGASFSQGICGIIGGKTPNMMTTELGKIRQVVPNAKLDIIPWKDVDGKSLYNESPVVSDWIMVPSYSKNAEVVAKYFDWMAANKDNFMLANYGIENKNWKKDGDQIEILGEGGRDNNKAYSGFYTMDFDMFGMKDYGRSPQVNFAKFTTTDPVRAAVQPEFEAVLKTIDTLNYTKKDIYGFSYELSGAALDSFTNRIGDVTTAVNSFIFGKATWDDVQKKIDAYAQNPGGPEELKQINDQAQAYEKKFGK